jgi:integrase
VTSRSAPAAPGRDRRPQRGRRVFLLDRLVTKLKRLWRWKQSRGEDLSPTAPRFDRLNGFHCLRHSAISSVYVMTHDLFLAQRFARHVSPLSPTVYPHPSDEETAGPTLRTFCLE